MKRYIRKAFAVLLLFILGVNLTACAFDWSLYNPFEVPYGQQLPEATIDGKADIKIIGEKFTEEEIVSALMKETGLLDYHSFYPSGSYISTHGYYSASAETNTLNYNEYILPVIKKNKIVGTVKIYRNDKGLVDSFAGEAFEEGYTTLVKYLNNGKEVAMVYGSSDLYTVTDDNLVTIIFGGGYPKIYNTDTLYETWNLGDNVLTDAIFNKDDAYYVVPQRVKTKKAVDYTPELEVVELEELDELDQDYIDGTMRFSVDLLKGSVAESEDVNENVLVSPLSVQLGLSIAANGADGETLKEMQKVLTGCEANPDGLDMDTLNTQLESQVAALENAEKIKVKIANSIWLNKKVTKEVSDDYLNRISSYRADFYVTRFNKTAMEDINSWVSQKTNKMIPSMLDTPLSEDSALCILDAMVFNAKWRDPVSSKLVRDGTFTNAAGEVQNVKIMENAESLYVEDEEVIGVVKEYKNERYAYVALLPKEGTAVEYVRNLDADKLAALLDNVQERDFWLHFPAYTSEYSVDLVDSLKALGMEQAFTKDADFSRICESAKKDMFINEVKHKTYIDVNQNGTRVAATTKVGLKYGGLGPEDDFYLDRPFVYAIIDTETNLPLFIGVLNSVE